MNDEGLIQEIRSHSARLFQAVANLRYWQVRYLNELRERYRQNLDELRSLSPWVALPWDDPKWQFYTPPAEVPLRPAVRIGRLFLGEQEGPDELPIFAPFIGHGHLWVKGSDRQVARSLLQTLLLRLVVSLPPGSLRLVLLDPEEEGAALAPFLTLPPDLRGEKVYAAPDELDPPLEELERHIDRLLQDGAEEHNSVASHNPDEVEVPYHVVALTGLPGRFDERALERLKAIARRGPRAGVYMVGLLSPTSRHRGARGLADLAGLGTTLHLDSSGRVSTWDSTLGGHYVEPDAMPEAAQVKGWLADIASLSQSFGRIAVPAAEYWQGSSVSGLQVSVGVDAAGEICQLHLGEGAACHGLIGGDAGASKANLLQTVIAQLALSYPPEELALYLVDFHGKALQLGLHLPHARVVGLESEREFGLSILRRLQAEMQDRLHLFAAAGQDDSDYAAYRQHSGQSLPRLLVILDEFQALFSEDDPVARQAGKILEDLARRGQTFGIHLLLSSRSPSAAGAPGSRVFDRLDLRICLPCQEWDARIVLGEENDAGFQLNQPGEAIVNDRKGEREHNVFLRMSPLLPQDRQNCLQAVRKLAEGRHYLPPVVSQAQSPARLESNSEFQALWAQPEWPDPEPAAPEIWLGDAVEIQPPTSVTLERSTGANLLIAGGKETQGYGLLLSGLLSLAVQRSPERARFIVVDFAQPDSPLAGLFHQIALPHQLNVVGPGQIESVLRELGGRVMDRTRTAGNGLNGGAIQGAGEPDIYFLVAGLHRWPDLSANGSVHARTTRKLLRLVVDGAQVGVHVLAWTASVAGLRWILEPENAQGFDLRVALPMPRPESHLLLRSPRASTLTGNRAFLYQRNWEAGRAEKFNPYGVPEPQHLAELVNRIQVKAPARIPEERVFWV